MITKETITACPTRIALDRLVQGLRPEEVDLELRIAIAERYFVYAEDRHEYADLIFAKALAWLGDQPFPYDDVDLGHAFCREATRQMVASRTDIQSLRLPSRARLSEWIPAILNNVQLTHLRATFLELEDADIRALEALPHLDYLDLDNTNLTDIGLESISRFRSLERLNLCETKVTSRGLARWLPTTLRSLSLSHITLDADLGAQLAECPNLESLYLKRSVVRVEGLQPLRRRPQLSRLWLDSCQLEDSHLEALSEITSLEDLSLDANAFTDVGLSFLARLPKLKELRVDDANLTNKGFNALKENSTLEVLSLDRAGSLVGLERPRWLASIKDLTVHDCELDPDFLAMLGEAVNLEKLSLEIEELDPAPLLESLQGLPVKELTLFLGDNSNHPVRCPSPLPLLEEVWLGISKAKRESIES